MCICIYLCIYKQPCSEKEFKKKKKMLPENYRCMRDPSPLGKEPGETGIARHQQLCAKRSAKKIGIICNKKTAFKAYAVTTRLWLGSSQLQEQSHSRQTNSALQLYLRSLVCSAFWKVQGHLRPLTFNLNILTVPQNRSARRFGPSHTCVSI